MTNSWTNADGEPIMDGAAYRYECALDDEYQPDPYEYEGYDEDPYYGDPEGCKDAGLHGRDADGNADGTWTCESCGEDCTDEMTNEDGLTDPEADAMALAGAGYGTDEDYGHFGDSDFFGEG